VFSGQGGELTSKALQFHQPARPQGDEQPNCAQDEAQPIGSCSLVAKLSRCCIQGLLAGHSAMAAVRPLSHCRRAGSRQA